MNDPYVVLGISSTASDDEVKSAYRTLAKKYHPDNYANTPDVADLAAEKMAQINEAYDTIVSSRKNGTPVGNSSSNAGNGNAGRDYGTFHGTQHTDFADVRNLFSVGKINEAEEVLRGVPNARRNAEWYFLMGTTFYRRGWMDQAYAHLQKAVNMAPNNTEYRAAFTQVSQQRTGRSAGYNYNKGSSGSSCGSGCGPCSTCVGLLCADSCCECFGGDLITCC